MSGDPCQLPSAAVDAISVGFTDSDAGCRAVLSPHLALVADAAATKPLRVSALKALLRRCAQRVAGAGAGDGGGKEAGRTRAGGVGVGVEDASCALGGGDSR